MLTIIIHIFIILICVIPVTIFNYLKNFQLSYYEYITEEFDKTNMILSIFYITNIIDITAIDINGLYS